MDVKYPNVTVPLVGMDSNAFSILGRVAGAMRSAGIPKADIDVYMNEAMSGDYDNLLRVTMATVNAE